MRDHWVFTLILRQELIMVSKADAMLHSPDNDDSTMGIPVYVGEHFAYGEHFHLSMRFLRFRPHAILARRNAREREEGKAVENKGRREEAHFNPTNTTRYNCLKDFAWLSQALP